MTPGVLVPARGQAGKSLRRTRPGPGRAGMPGRQSGDCRTASPARPLRLGFILAEGFTLSAFSLFVDTLRLAGDVEGRSGTSCCDWEVIGDTPIRSSCGVAVHPTALPGDVSRFDYLVVVGGATSRDTVCAFTRDYVRSAGICRIPLIGLCAGSFVLAECGLLEGRLCCVSRAHLDHFRERFPHVRVTSQQPFVCDRGVMTCAGGRSVADAAAFLARKHIGIEAERNALDLLQIESRERADRFSGPVAIPVPVRHDARIKASLLHMEKCLDRRVDLASIARQAGVSRRQLERIFMERAGTSPMEALTRLRISRACTLLEHTSDSITNVALEVGFENSSYFTRKFREAIGLTPSNFRRQRQQGSSHQKRQPKGSIPDLSKQQGSRP